MFYPVVFSLYNPAIVYGNLELAPPTEHQLVCMQIVFFPSFPLFCGLNKLVYNILNTTALFTDS